MRQNPFRKYKGLVRGQILNTFSYKFNIYSWLVGDLVGLIILVFLWVAIYKENGSQVINGFTFNEMIFYLVNVSVAMTIGQGATNSFSNVANDIYKGEIAVSLTKPVNYRLKCFFVAVGNLLGNFVILFIPLFTIEWLVFTLGLGISFPIYYNLIFFFISSLLAFVLADCFYFLLGQLSFVTQSAFGVIIIANTIMGVLSGSMIPFSFYPKWLADILIYLPFSGLSSTPTLLLMGKYSLVEAAYSLLLQFGWSVVLLLLSLLVNKQMLKRTTSSGG